VTVIAAPIITGATLLKLIIGAVVAGLGVTLGFSLVIYCTDRASELRRENRRGTRAVFQAASVIAVLGVGAIVAYGLILTVSKPK
jgi:TRAP-type C4-dicarboxylate transport system permease large subunit